MPRLAIAALIAALLGGLIAWQWSRERQMAACEAAGGSWNGAQSRCEPPPGRPILKRAIERSLGDPPQPTVSSFLRRRRPSCP